VGNVYVFLVAEEDLSAAEQLAQSVKALVAEAIAAAAPPKGPAGKRLLSQREAAGYLGVSVRKVQEMGAAGQLPKVALGGRTLYDIRDLDAIIDQAKA
jgi:excisionase family DNA binding protein